MDHPQLDAAIEVQDGADVESLWELFEIFEALHHTMRIANPMSSEDLDDVVALLAPTDGESVLDIACGYGELLLRLRRQAEIDGLGADLSPWMIHAAHSYAKSERVDGLRWMVGEASKLPVEPTYDVVTCLGATWIWHGFNGTVRAISERTSPGGRIAIGEMHIRDGIDPEAATQPHGRLMSHQELDETFDRHGIDVIGRIRTADHSWDDYLARTATSAVLWQELHPSEAADRYVAEQQEWESDHARDRQFLTWSVWVGVKREA